MARVRQTGFEIEDNPNSYFQTIAPDVVFIGSAYNPVRNTTCRSGNYSFISSTLLNTQAILYYFSTSSSTDLYVQVYFRYSTLPTSNLSVLHFSSDDGTTELATNLRGLVFRTNGSFAAYNNTGTQIGSNSAVAPANTWNRIAYRIYTSGGTAQNVTVRINNEEICTDQQFKSSFSAINIIKILTTSGNGSTTFYLDDFVVNDNTGSYNNSWPDSDKIVLLLPISDTQIGAWTRGAGGTTNLYDAINNTPPIGTDLETNLTQIECASKDGLVASATGSFGYQFNLETFSTKGISTVDFITATSIHIMHGEDIATGTKTITYKNLSNPADTSEYTITPVGNNQGALSGFPINWSRYNSIPIDVPSINKAVSPNVGLGKTDGTTRVASVCFVGMYVAYLEIRSIPSMRAYPRTFLTF